MDLLISSLIVIVILILSGMYVYYGYNKERLGLEEELQRYKSILANTVQGILVVGNKGEVLFLNEETKRFLKRMELNLSIGDPIELLLNRLNQFSDLDEIIQLEHLNATDQPKKFVFKFRGLFANFAYYEVMLTPYLIEDQLKGQVLVVRNVTNRVVTETIHKAIIKSSQNTNALKNIEDALKYFGGILEDVVDIDYVFATIIEEETMTYHSSHRGIGNANKIVKINGMSPLSAYVLEKDEAVIMTATEIEAAGLDLTHSFYEDQPELMIACPMVYESTGTKGVVGLLFTSEMDYPELIKDSLEVIARYIAQINERLLIENKIHSLAYYDQLTGLPNRSKFIMSLEQEIINISLSGSQLLGVLFLDFSGLKKINDEFSHHVGDQLLKKLAKALVESNDGMYVIGRLGGDEFGIYTIASTHAEIEGIANLILNTVDTPYMIDGHRVHVTGNIGISVFEQHGTYPEELIHKADEALFEAKKLGKSRYFMWD